MGVPQTTHDNAVPVAMISSIAPEVAVEDEGDLERVFLKGTMFHDGLNANAWGLTETGAEAVVGDFLGDDHVLSHPFIRNGRYDRSLADGPGFPIGEVVSADVVQADSMLDGGGYTAEYVSEIKDPIYAQRYKAGNYSNDLFSVSIGIYGDPESATCSVCQNAMATEACDHDRFDEVQIEKSDGSTETKVAGPLYDDAITDHLASVYMPAYEGAEATVATVASGDVSGDTPPTATTSGDLANASAATAGDVPMAASVLGAAHDGADETTEDPTPADTSSASDRGTQVRLRASTRRRNSTEVRFRHD